MKNNAIAFKSDKYKYRNSYRTKTLYGAIKKRSKEQIQKMKQRRLREIALREAIVNFTI